MAEPIMEYLFTPHARLEMARRGVSETVVRQVLSAPEQRDTNRPGRDVLQSRMSFADGTYLVRVFVDVDRKPAQIVTVYRTSKINKYLRADS